MTARGGPRVVITGGGTGGHVYPGLAVAAALRRLTDCDVRWVGTARGIESILVPRAGYRLHRIPASGLRGVGHRARLLFLLNFAAGFVRSLILLAVRRPLVVFGTGGFVCAPVLAAARVLGVPSAVHESNAVPGSANRLVGRWARRVYLGVAAAAQHFPAGICRTTGNPVRPEFRAAAGAGDARLAEFGQPGRRVLVFGGSAGARTLNRAVCAAAPAWAHWDETAFLVQTGKRDQAEVVDAVAAAGAQEAIRIRPYIDEMAAALRWADLVVCRAGAMTLTELQAAGRPAILVPFPHATDDHQLHNARELEAAGAARVLADDACDGPALTALIGELLGDPDGLARMGAAAAALARPGAADRIAGDLLAVGGHPAGTPLPPDA